MASALDMRRALWRDAAERLAAEDAAKAETGGAGASVPAPAVPDRKDAAKEG